MRVLVWQSWGSIGVFKAETPPEFTKIIKRLGAEMGGWGEDEALATLEDQLGRANSQKQGEAAIVEFVAPHLGTHETFEFFQFQNIE